jgi:hypothetical protein
VGAQTAATGIVANVQATRPWAPPENEQVVPLVAGGLAHFWRDNDAAGLPWNEPIPFGSSDTYDAVALIQSNFSSAGYGPGDLEVVARSGNRLDFYWREDAPPFVWHGPIAFATV